MEISELLNVKTALYSLITLMKSCNGDIELEIMNKADFKRIALVEKDYIDTISYDLSSAELVTWGIGENKIIAWIRLEKQANE